MKRGNAILLAADQRFLAERDAVVNTTICMWCGEVFTGPLGETRGAYLAHRLEQHPEVQPKPKRKRHRHQGQMNVGKNLDENIANARKQGSATWAGPE